MDTKINSFDRIRDKWLDFKSKPENKKIRIRDAAHSLNTCEAELLSTEIGDNVMYLNIPDFNIFFKELFALDKVMFLIRTDSVVHEKTVLLKDLEFVNNHFIYLSDKTSLLTFDCKLLKYVFFEKKEHVNRKLRSFQFFDNNGHAVLKIYLKGHSKNKFDEIALKYKIDYNYELQSILSTVNKEKQDIDKLIDVDLFFLSDNNFKCEKKLFKGKILRYFLESISSNAFPIQIHAMGIESIQYHRDCIKNVVDYGPWINVMDKNFNIHVLEKNIHISVLVKYLINNEQHYSIEFFDKNNIHVLGIAPINGFEDKFYKIIHDLEENNYEAK